MVDHYSWSDGQGVSVRGGTTTMLEGACAPMRLYVCVCAGVFGAGPTPHYSTVYRAARADMEGTSQSLL
jgi:hypothetical protein